MVAEVEPGSTIFDQRFAVETGRRLVHLPSSMYRDAFVAAI